MDYADYSQLLSRFLETASTAEKWRIVGPTELRLERAMRKAFTQQGATFLDGFKGLQGRFQESVTESDWQVVFDAATDETFNLFLEPIESAIGAGLTEGARRFISEVGIDVAFSLRNPRAVSYVQEHGATLVTNINETTRDYVRTVIQQGVDEGWSYNRMARALRERYAEFAGTKPQQHIQSRAHLIAVTEAGNAYEEGNQIVARDLQDNGIDLEKQWLTVGDDRVSDGCAANQAEGWIPYSQPHLSGHMRPLRFPGCRCTEQYRAK